jgi:hypothetical protein
VRSIESKNKKLLKQFLERNKNGVARKLTIYIFLGYNDFNNLVVLGRSWLQNFIKTLFCFFEPFRTLIKRNNKFFLQTFNTV